MPVVSPARRYSTTSGSTYLPPSGLRSSTTTAGTSKYDYTALTSSYRTTLNNTSNYPRSSVYRSSLYTPGVTASSLSRFSVYGTNNDTTTTSNRFGVSSINNKIHSRYSRSSSDSRDTASLLSSSTERKSRFTSSNYKTGLTSTYSHKKPPSGGVSNTNNTLSLNPKHKDLNNNVNNSFTRNKNNNNNNTNTNCNLIRKSSSSDQVITSKSDQNDLNYVNKSSNLKSSSLALQVATSGLDLYEKYSPSNYIPNCELSRSRSLSEATPTQSSTSIKNNNNITTKRHSLYSNDSKINNNKKDKDKDKDKINNYDNYNNNNDINNDEDKLELSTTQLANKTKIQPISKDQKCTNGTTKSTAATATDPITSPLQITGLNYPTANTTNTSTTTISTSAAASKIITSNSLQINGTQKDNIFSTKIGSHFRDTNFLKTECDLARQQVVKTKSISKEKLKQEFETNNNNNNICNNNNSSNNSINGNNNEIDVLNLHPKTFKHKTSEKIAKTTKLLQKQFHNNMNCFQNNLDDIKFIDSDESERQSNSSTATFNNKTSIKLETTKNDIPSSHQQKLHSQKSSTLPITTKRTTNLLNNHNSPIRTEDGQHQNLSVMSRITTFNNKYNTLNEFNRSSGSSSNVRNPLKSNSIQNASNTIGQTITQPILNNLKKSTVIISGNNTGSNASSNLHNNSINSYNEKKLHNKNTLPNVILNNGHNSVILKNSTSHIPINSCAISNNVVVSNNIANDSTSNHSSASSSPQIQRRNILDQNAKTLFFNGITNANALNINKIEIPSNSNNATVVNVISSDAIDSNDSNKSIKLIINNDDSNIKLNIQSNTINSNECDNDESIRNTSLRNTTASPSRYYDRDGKLSTLSSRLKDEDEYSSNNKSKSHKSESDDYEGLCGLRNIGNTCFMNSVIQCLSHTCELTKFLKTQNCIRTTTKDQQILCEFAKLIREMWTSSVSTVTPSELKSAFSSKHRMYSGYNQQDAQEFLRFFLDSLHSALNSGSKGDPLRIDETLSDNKIADVTWDWYCKLENSVVRDLFVGQLKSTLRCTTCGNTSVTFDPFWDLSVPLPSSSRCKIEQCLDLFIKEEVLDGDEMPKCSKCRARRKCTKTFTIQRFPKYLVIHLKRFSETRWSKMTNIVEFPTGERELNMGPYAANPNINVHYSLYAISNHMGSTAGGHYVALCKHPGSKRWHEFNDNIVSDEIPESNLISSSAYLLFFERARNSTIEDQNFAYTDQDRPTYFFQSSNHQQIINNGIFPSVNKKIICSAETSSNNFLLYTASGIIFYTIIILIIYYLIN